MSFIPYAEWKARELNRLFKDGHITADTVRHGLRNTHSRLGETLPSPDRATKAEPETPNSLPRDEA